MEHEKKGFKFVLIDEPNQAQVVAYEQAARGLQNANAKPALNRVMSELRKVDVTNTNTSALISTFHLIAQALEEATKIINDNESLSLSANDAVIVKAAIKSGWIISPEMTEADIDEMRPAWRVRWMAELLLLLYMEVTTIPKN